MRNNEDPKDQQALELLETLKEVPERDSRFAAHGKARFLAEARYVQKTVSPSPYERLNGWMSERFETVALYLVSLRKERSHMYAAISSLILIVAVMFGSTGATVFAAQDSLPTDLLYPVKLFIEDARYTLATDAEAQVDLLISFANNRVDEILDLIALGEPVPDSVMDDLQADLDNMLQLAADMEVGETQQGTLRHIRDQLRTQKFVMNMTGQPEDVEPALEQLQQMLQAVHQRAAAGEADPLLFKHMFRNNQGENTGGPNDETDPKGNQNANCTETGDCEPHKRYEWDDPGIEDMSNADPGNADPGNADPGNAEPGLPGGNTDPGNAAPGNADPGNADPGTSENGNTDPGNTDPGDPDPGNTDPGNPDPGSGEPGDPDPGNPDPGDPDPGDPDPGRGKGGDDGGEEP